MDYNVIKKSIRDELKSELSALIRWETQCEARFFNELTANQKIAYSQRRTVPKSEKHQRNWKRYQIAINDVTTIEKRLKMRLITCA